MKQFTHRHFLSVVIIASSVLFLGCSSSEAPNTDSTSTSADQSSNTRSNGNMLHILRDAADMQLKTGDYIEQLRLSQNNLQQAIETQDQTALKQNVDQLKQQLVQLDEKLKSFNLKSQEVESLRVELLQFNQKALAMPIFNSKLDLSKQNFDALQEQLNNIQSDIVQLASMAIPNELKDMSQNLNSENTNESDKNER